MKFEIKSWDGSVLFALECDSFRLCVEAAAKTGADLTGADLTSAVLAGADLTGVYLARANLTGADLTRADLTGASLTGVNLTSANLTRANLTRANLAGADLTGADLTGAKGVATAEESDALLAQIADIVLARPERLEMNCWHGPAWDWTHTPQEAHTCGTTHCLAGWAQALCSVGAIRRMDPLQAGVMLIPTAAHLFYASNEAALAFLRGKQRAAPAPETAQ